MPRALAPKPSASVADLSGGTVRPLPAPYDEAGRQPEESLFVLLATAARQRSDGVLAAWAGAGCVLAVVLGIALPEWRVTFLLSVCGSAFGLWGIADRELSDARACGGTAGRRVRALRVLRGTIAAVGVTAGALALLAGFAAALGTWTS